MNDVSQLALSIQRGRDDLIPELWKAVRDLVAWFAKKFYLLREEECNRHKIEVDDLIQEGYFALLNSIRKYDPEKGAFSTFLAWDLRHSFQTAMGRTTRQRGDKLNNCLSLDAELDTDDPDSESLYNLVPDGVDYAAAIEHKVYLQQLREELEKVLAAIPVEQAEVIKESFYNGKTLTEIAAGKSQTVENIRRKQVTGLRAIRQGKYIRELERFVDLETNFFRKVSVDSFNATHTSSVEGLVLFREKKRGEYYRSIC